VIDLALACPGCGAPVEAALEPGTTALACAKCGRETPLPGAGEIATTGRVAACPVCGSADLYSQRDFNRTLGLAIVAVGLGLGPFTQWISVGVAVVVDAVLYLVVPTVTVCYACNAQLRGLAKEVAPPAFDIAVHDAYKFGKRFPPRRDLAVAGPLMARLRREGKAP
jgi:DNA-directed RNA polymerase subunit RPC12/RpoP